MDEITVYRSRYTKILAKQHERVVFIEDLMLLPIIGFAFLFWFAAVSCLSLFGTPGASPGSHILYWLAYVLNVASPALFPDTASAYYGFMGQLHQQGQFHKISIPFIVATFFGFVGAWLSVKVFIRPQSSMTHTRGAKLMEGLPGLLHLKRILDAEVKANPIPAPSIALAVLPGEDILNIKDSRKALWIAHVRNATHTLLLGSTRSGKSQALKRYLAQMLAQKQRVVILDKKGEYTEMMDMRRTIVIGLHDARQSSWDMASDLLIIQDILTFWESFIQVSDKDPFWGNATILIMSALTISLLKMHGPRNWTIRQLVDLKNGPVEAMIPLVEQHYPAALKMIKMEGQTLNSILANIAASTKSLDAMADVWGNGNYPKFSINQWLYDTNPKKRNLLFKSSGQFEAINDPVIRAMLGYMARIIDSDGFADEASSNPRNINFIADEFQSFGNLEKFIKSLTERAASKGARVYLACQDISQLQEVYSPEFVKFLTSNTGNILICGAQLGETSQYFSNMVGDYSFEKMHVSQTAQVDSSNKTLNYQEHSAKVMTANEFTSKLGAKNGEIRFLYMGSKINDVYIIHQPIIRFKKISEPVVFASWVKGADAPAAPTPPLGVNPAPSNTAQPFSPEVYEPSQDEPGEIDPELDIPDEIEGQRVAISQEQSTRVYNITEAESLITPATFVAPLVGEALGAPGAEHLLDLIEGLAAPAKQQTTSKLKLREKLEEKFEKASHIR